ncbi:Intermediate filament protein [Physocladia obscura]|uniref:Intermediate filament protein n=1 Tax=Physocladia obscura TaxID=109957 RepID=A0AAD5ST17_9FUNG|nr:Intermediate filament protein [Physocladia obscura]
MAECRRAAENMANNTVTQPQSLPLSPPQLPQTATSRGHNKFQPNGDTDASITADETALLLACFNNAFLHPALESWKNESTTISATTTVSDNCKKSEIDHLKRICTKLFPLLFDAADIKSPLFQFLVVEVLTGQILKNLVDLFADPDFWNLKFDELGDKIISQEHILAKRFAEAVEKQLAGAAVDEQQYVDHEQLSLEENEISERITKDAATPRVANLISRGNLNEILKEIKNCKSSILAMAIKSFIQNEIKLEKAQIETLTKEDYSDIVRIKTLKTFEKPKRLLKPPPSLPVFPTAKIAESPFPFDVMNHLSTAPRFESVSDLTDFYDTDDTAIPLDTTIQILEFLKDITNSSFWKDVTFLVPDDAEAMQIDLQHLQDRISIRNDCKHLEGAVTAPMLVVNDLEPLWRFKRVIFEELEASEYVAFLSSSDYARIAASRSNKNKKKTGRRTSAIKNHYHSWGGSSSPSHCNKVFTALNWLGKKEKICDTVSGGCVNDVNVQHRDHLGVAVDEHSDDFTEDEDDEDDEYDEYYKHGMHSYTIPLKDEKYETSDEEFFDDDEYATNEDEESMAWKPLLSGKRSTQLLSPRSKRHSPRRSFEKFITPRRPDSSTQQKCPEGDKNTSDDDISFVKKLKNKAIEELSSWKSKKISIATIEDEQHQKTAQDFLNESKVSTRKNTVSTIFRRSLSLNRSTERLSTSLYHMKKDSPFSKGADFVQKQSSNGSIESAQSITSEDIARPKNISKSVDLIPKHSNTFNEGISKKFQSISTDTVIVPDITTQKNKSNMASEKLNASFENFNRVFSIKRDHIPLTIKSNTAQSSPQSPSPSPKMKRTDALNPPKISTIVTSAKYDSNDKQYSEKLVNTKNCFTKHNVKVNKFATKEIKNWKLLGMRNAHSDVEFADSSDCESGVESIATPPLLSQQHLSESVETVTEDRETDLINHDGECNKFFSTTVLSPANDKQFFVSDVLLTTLKTPRIIELEELVENTKLELEDVDEHLASSQQQELSSSRIRALNLMKLGLQVEIKRLEDEKAVCKEQDIENLISPQSQKRKAFVKNLFLKFEEGFKKHAKSPTRVSNTSKGLDDSKNSPVDEQFDTVDVLFDLITEIFELKERRNFIRRKALNLVLQHILGGTIERRISENLRSFVTEDAMAAKIESLRISIFDTEYLARTLEMKAKTRQVSSSKMMHLAVGLIGSVVGKKNAKRGALKFMWAFQSSILNRQLVYTVLDELLISLFDLK